jgi:hypothetical protein
MLNHHVYTENELFLKNQYAEALRTIGSLAKELEQEKTAHEMTAMIAESRLQELKDLRDDYEVLQDRYADLEGY